jgi:hypothetical protein
MKDKCGLTVRQKSINGKMGWIFGVFGENQEKGSSFEWSNGIFSQNGFLKKYFGDKGKEYPAPGIW